MYKVEAIRQDIDLNEYKRRTALESDADIIINYDCLFTEDGKPIILYKKLDDINTDALRWACQTVKYNSSTRTGGLKTTSTIFGYSPKIALRKDFCAATAMSRNEPKQHYIITEFAAKAALLYEEYFPDVYKHHATLTKERIKPQWVIPNSPFTSGIVNKNNPLKYHHDAGNFKHVLSNMVAFKEGVKGGRLVLPEFGIKLEIADNTIVIFDGQQILHGVTPIEFVEEDAYRYTVVYYTLEQMWNCQNVNDEIARIRKVKKQREIKRMSHHNKT